MHVDLIVYNAGRLVTCAGTGPKRGAALRDVAAMTGGALAVRDGLIVAVGDSDAIRRAYSATEEQDAGGRAVVPGLVDCHTHVVYGGDRAQEFALRIGGASYLDILAAGGGIISTTSATRNASAAELYKQARARLDAMLALGTTTAEAKTGYGLDTVSECKTLDVIAALDADHPIDLVPTFLGAHAVAPEYAGRPDAYVDYVIEEMLPAVAAWHRTSSLRSRPLYCDVFCEHNAFSVAQMQRVFTAAQRHAMPLKAHVDEFNALGGTALAIAMNAVSVDHLDVTTPADVALLARSDTIGVIMPAVNFNFGSSHFADARAMIDEGAAIALATDINPGSAPCPSLPLVMAIACRYQKLLPAEALNACTINAAYAMGMGEQVGSLEAGKQADFLILHERDEQHLAYQFGGNSVAQVFKRGRRVLP